MAEITTTVSSPDGPLYRLPGRIPQGVALSATEGFLRSRLAATEKALAQVTEWTVESQRGSERVRSFEEMSDGQAASDGL